MTSPAMGIDNVSSTKDKDWVRASFMLAVNRWKPNEGTLQKKSKEWLYFSTANYKASNTSLGGNSTINSIAQFTHTCDIPRGGLASTAYLNESTTSSSSTGGMGRYYSESIDDWSMKVSFRFGMPEYKGLITFFASFYDAGAAMLGRQGRLSEGLFYNVAKVITSLIALPLTVMVWVGEAMQWMSNRPSSRYYNLKPAMALYWRRVNLIANMMAANMNLIPRDQNYKPEGDITDVDPRFNEDRSGIAGSYAYNTFKNAYPDMFLKQGGINVYHLATKFNRMTYARNQQIKDMLETNGSDWLSSLKGDVDKHLNSFVFSDHLSAQTSMDDYLTKYHKSPLGYAAPGESDIGVEGSDQYANNVSKGVIAAADGSWGQNAGGTSVNTIEDTGLSDDPSEGAQGIDVDPATGEPIVAAAGGADINQQRAIIGEGTLKDSADDNLIFTIMKESEADTTGGTVLERVKGWGQEFINYSRDIAADGGQWINFRVDYTKSMDESFSNEVGPSEIQGKINGMSSSASAVRFGLSDFQTGFGAVDGVVSTIRDTFMGVADGLHIGGLAALMGGGYVDIPQRWMDSSTQMPTASYSIKCRPPYGNIMSRFLNMHVPIACLLAATLPISYGRHAYGAPMLCEFYVQGKNQSRLAMITSLSITRGEGNLGWSQDGDYLGCDINFEITDLSTIMHAPIDSGMNQLGNLRWLMADDNVFNDYMAVLSNLSVAEMSYSWEKLKLNWNKFVVTQQTYLSPSNIAMGLGDMGPGHMLRKFTPGQNASIQ